MKIIQIENSTSSIALMQHLIINKKNNNQYKYVMPSSIIKNGQFVKSDYTLTTHTTFTS